MPFKALNNCGQPWTREWNFFLKSEVNSWATQRIPVGTHTLLSLCDHGKPQGRWCEQRASLSSLWQWVILLPNITLWRSPPIFCFWVEAEREIFCRLSMRKIQLFVFNFASSFSKRYIGTAVAKTIMCQVLSLSRELLLGTSRMLLPKSENQKV